MGATDINFLLAVIRAYFFITKLECTHPRFLIVRQIGHGVKNIKTWLDLALGKVAFYLLN